MHVIARLVKVLLPGKGLFWMSPLLKQHPWANPSEKNVSFPKIPLGTLGIALPSHPTENTGRRTHDCNKHFGILFCSRSGGTLETMEQNMNNESFPGEAHKR